MARLIAKLMVTEANSVARKNSISVLVNCHDLSAFLTTSADRESAETSAAELVQPATRG